MEHKNERIAVRMNKRIVRNMNAPRIEVHPTSDSSIRCLLYGVNAALLLQIIIFWHEQAEHPEIPGCSKFLRLLSARHSNSQRTPLASYHLTD